MAVTGADFEQILHRDMAIARAVFLGASHLIVATDRDGTIIAMNPAAERALGWSKAELVGRVSPILFHDRAEVAARARALEAQLGRRPDGYEVFVSRLVEQGEEREWTYVRKDGTRFPVLLAVTALKDACGQVIGYVGISTDISERKRMEAAELAATSERLQRQWADQANAAKSRFLAAASHDLRQPFQAVHLYLEALRGLISDERKANILSRAEEALGNCQSLLDALLDVSVLEAGAVRVRPERFRLAELVEQLAGEIKPLAQERGLAFRWRGPALHAHLETDRTLLARALRNLLVNALRYTERGGVLLGVRRHRGEALLQVWDTGIGIAAEHLHAIFETFYQVGNPARDRKQGLGLGLSVAEKTVKLLGGRIEVSSRPGAGSVFTIRLPVAA